MSIINVNEIGPISLGSTVTLTAGSTLKLPTNSKISGDTGSIIVPGTLVQVGYSRYDPNGDTYTTVAQDTELTSDVSLTFTPKFATSKLYVTSQYHSRIINANGITFGIYRDGTKVDGMYQRNSLDFSIRGIKSIIIIPEDVNAI